MNVYACLPRLILKKALLNRELYVVSLASDLRGDSNHRQPATGGANEILSAISSDVQAAMKFIVVAASNIFHNIDKHQPVLLGGDGIVLYPPSNPQGMLSLHFSVVESDKGARNLGKLLKSMFSDKEVKGAMSEIGKFVAASGSVPEALVIGLIGAATTALSAGLEANGDDILLDYSFSGRAISAYGGSPAGTEYFAGNKKVECLMKVYVED